MKTVLSTKKLSSDQKLILQKNQFKLVEYDAIEVVFLDFGIESENENLIFTSQNGVLSYLDSKHDGKGKKAFCVGQKTKSYLESNGFKVVIASNNSRVLSQVICQTYKNEAFTYYSGNLRLGHLPNELNKNNVRYNEIVVYKTKLKPKRFMNHFDGIFFFSPSAAKSFFTKNNIHGSLAFCIGETTAEALKKYTDNYIISDKPTIEDTLEKVVKHFELND